MSTFKPQVGKTMQAVRRYALPVFFTAATVLIGGCNSNTIGNKQQAPSGNEPRKFPRYEQKKDVAKPNVRVREEGAMVTTRDGLEIYFDLSGEMRKQKVSSLLESTWESMDDADGMRIYSIYPKKSFVHTKDSTATFSIILLPPAEEKAAETKNAQI